MRNIVLDTEWNNNNVTNNVSIVVVDVCCGRFVVTSYLAIKIKNKKGFNNSIVQIVYSAAMDRVSSFSASTRMSYTVEKNRGGKVR